MRWRHVQQQQQEQQQWEVLKTSVGRVFKEIAEQRFPLSVFLAEALPIFVSCCTASAAFSVGAATAAAAENLAAAVVNNVSLYVETM